MPTVRIALANLPYPSSPDDSVARAVAAIADAGTAGADVICFPEAYVPGYRGLGHEPPPADAAFLTRAWDAVAQAAGRANVAVVLGTERLAENGLRISALVVHRDGSVAGFQDKVQLDPSEDNGYVPGDSRQVFTCGALTFGVVICHEGWRYPETVRWATRHGAQLVFHPHLHEAELASDGSGSFAPTEFADPRNSFHEKAALCRAAENVCFFATVNYASDGSPTTSAVVRPDGTLLAFQPYGQAGLLVTDIEPDEATLLLAKRLRTRVE